MKVAIIGAGVGGLVTAIALARSGVEVEVFERRAAGDGMGGGVVCWPNACFVLDEFGMLEDVAAVSGRPGSMHRITGNGELLGSLDIALLNDTMGYPSYSILRRDLLAILLRHALGHGAAIHYERPVVRIESNSRARAELILADGNRVSADLVIGADGRMRSLARAFVTGGNRPVFQRFVNWIGVFEASQPVFDEMAVFDYWGIGERFGIIPIDTRRAYWAAGAFAAEPGEPLREEALAARFEHWPEPVAAVIRGTSPQAVSRIAVHDHDPAGTWYRDNVLMIGDAAHAALPTSGQGACQAMEDAWHLAAILGRLSNPGASEMAAALQEFQAIRHAKTRGICAGARHLAASIFNPDENHCARRNRESQATDYVSMAMGMASGWASGLPIGS